MNKTRNNENSVYSEEEYEAALAKLNKSKHSRERSVVKEQKQKKKSEKVTQSGKKHNKTFIEKCKEDIVIPICLLSILLVIISIVLYFTLPTIYVKSFGMNIDEFRKRYESTSIYNEYLLGYSFEIPEVSYTVSIPNLDVDSTEVTDNSDKYNYFSVTIPNTATSFSTGIQGSTRKVDNKISSLRVLTEYKSDASYFDFMCKYFASYAQTIYPKLTKDEAIQMVQDALGQMQSGTTPFIVKEDYAYRILIGQDNNIAYVAMDFITADRLEK